MHPIWLDPHVLLSLHNQLINEYGGLEGLRDTNLLESALMRPQHLLIYENPSIFELAAAITYGIVKNHPFLDGNKRTAFMAAYIFLVRNGYTPSMSEIEVVVMMRKAAASEISEAELAKWFSENYKTI